MGRFDYVEYDQRAQNIQKTFKEEFEKTEAIADQFLKSPRYKALVMTKLEEAYMYVGKAIRDDQIERNGEAKLQEQRTNS